MLSVSLCAVAKSSHHRRRRSRSRTEGLPSSRRTPLSSLRTNGLLDVARLDRSTGDVLLMSVSTSGSSGDAGTSTIEAPALSAERNVVAYSSNSSNLVANDTNGEGPGSRGARDGIHGRTLTTSSNSTMRSSASSPTSFRSRRIETGSRRPTKTSSFSLGAPPLEICFLRASSLPCLPRCEYSSNLTSQAGR